MKVDHNFFIKAAPLLLVLFIDGMGLSLIMPILSALMFDPNSHFFANPQIGSNEHNLMYGAIIGLYMLCWFFGAAVLGDLSDSLGRKKCLMICLLGAGISYLISAVAVVFQSMSLLLVGRVIAGLTSGSQPIAQAAIIDLSDDAHKARNIGFILLAISLGFILGPLFGGILSDSKLVSWFNYAVPFYFATGISFINIILLWYLFKDSVIPKKTKIPLCFYKAIEIFISAFKHERISKLSLVFFIFVFGWSSFYSFIPLFLVKRYEFSSTQISLFMALMGVGFCVGTGLLVQYLTKRWSLADVFKVTTSLGAFFIFVMAVTHHVWLSELLVAPIACCVSIAYSVIVTIFSDQVDANSQGWIMGITGSIMALVWAINGVVIGIVAIYGATLPLLVAVVSLFVSVACYRGFVK